MICVDIKKGSFRVPDTGSIGRNREATWPAFTYRLSTSSNATKSGIIAINRRRSSESIRVFFQKNTPVRSRDIHGFTRWCDSQTLYLLRSPMFCSNWAHISPDTTNNQPLRTGSRERNNEEISEFHHPEGK